MFIQLKKCLRGMWFVISSSITFFFPLRRKKMKENLSGKNWHLEVSLMMAQEFIQVVVKVASQAFLLGE